MKIITATARARGRDREADDTFPIMTSATIDGYTLQNANGEACGGTFLNAFAVSCNSVFAPAGSSARRGAAGGRCRALRVQPAAVDPRRRREPDPVREHDRRRPGRGIVGDRPGDGADHRPGDDRRRRHDRDGRAPADPHPPGPPAAAIRPVTARRVAGLVQQDDGRGRDYGTGTAAADPGSQGRGQNRHRGAQEHRPVPSTNPNAPAPTRRSTPTPGSSATPRSAAPRIVVGALFPDQGAGGGTAAPAVHDVLVAALQAH